tara:strand:- start:3363 stop:3494 length:132 start_codon:yes stop_codon:yes gene_type:complete
VFVFARVFGFILMHGRFIELARMFGDWVMFWFFVRVPGCLFYH